MNRNHDGRPHVIIVGGGFGGLEAARRLRKAPVRITLIDKRNFHLFQPLLYQVASAALAPGDISEPIRGALSGQQNARVMLGSVEEVDLGSRRVRVDGAGGERWLAYDRLILAAGLRHSYFGHEAEWARHAPGLKGMDDALEIRRRILLAFEEAEWADDPAERQRLLTFVVVGGGPTGVELAGQIVEIAQRSIVEDFGNIDTSDARVILIEAANAVLPPYPEDLQESARKQLADLGVEIRTGWMVTQLDGQGVSIKKGDEEVAISARTVLWAAGLRAVSLTSTMDVPKDRLGRVQVQPDLSVPGHPDVFVVGDLAVAIQPDGKPAPGVAQTAIQGGRHVARIIAREAKAASGGPLSVLPDRPPFVYDNKGSMATIGRKKAVVEFKHLHLSGRIAWLIWLFIHVFFLIGFRNRVVVMFQWAWSYFTWERTNRLIRGREWARPDAETPFLRLNAELTEEIARREAEPARPPTH